MCSWGALSPFAHLARCLRSVKLTTHKHVSHYHVQMNITMSIDDDLLAAAKALAARRGTSVSGLVRSALEQQIAVDEQVSASGASGVLRVLADYSTGKSPRGVVMQELAIDDYGELLQLLNTVGLPHPIVPIATRKEMVRKMVTMLADPGRGL